MELAELLTVCTWQMELSGEASDKFSVWKKARKESDPEVAQVIVCFSLLLCYL